MNAKRPPKPKQEVECWTVTAVTLRGSHSEVVAAYSMGASHFDLRPASPLGPAQHYRLCQRPCHVCAKSGHFLGGRERAKPTRHLARRSLGASQNSITGFRSQLTRSANFRFGLRHTSSRATNCPRAPRAGIVMPAFDDAR
jgi:hypothetical protein